MIIHLVQLHPAKARGLHPAPRGWIGVAALAFLLVGGGSVDSRAAWTPDGLKINRGHPGYTPGLVQDGAGGAYCVWASDDTYFDVYLQRIGPVGAPPAGWPAAEFPVCVAPTSQFRNGVAADGLGGVFVAWDDRRNFATGGTSVDIYAQHVMADRSLAAGWATDGMPVSRRPVRQDTPEVISDGAGGAYFTWREDSSGDVYAQRLAGNGAPGPGWPADGLAICTAPGFQGNPLVAPDAAGGLLIVWGDIRSGGFEAYGQRVTPDAQILWQPDGVRIAAIGAIRGGLVSDDAGGGYMCTATLEPAGQDKDYYLFRFTGDGAPAPGWSTSGVLVCSAPDDRAGIRMTPDGAGGVYLAWYDYRDDFDDEIFLARFRPDGSPYPGWPPNGLRVTDNNVYDNSPELAPDGSGGVFVCWERTGGPLAGEKRIVVQHLNGAGTVVAGWPPEGYVIPSTNEQSNAQITSDGFGGAYVAWDECCSSVWMQRFVADGVVATELALVSASAGEGRVRLEWYGAHASRLAATVERRLEGSGWVAAGEVRADGTGRIVFEESGLAAGRYAYRLRYRDGAIERTGDDAWVVVPEALTLALEGFRPNPASGTPRVWFTLPHAAPARLEVFDLAGRRVVERDLGTPGPGSHLVPIGSESPLAAGAYVLRLTHGERQVTARGVVLR